MIIIIYFVFRAFHSFIRLKWNYFFEFHSWIQIGIIICSWLSVGISIWRYRECSRIGQLLRQTNGSVYINLQFLTYVNDLLRYIYGLCCFFGTLTLLRFCHYNHRLSLFTQTLNRVKNELLSFSLMFCIVFVAIACLFYLLFQWTLWSLLLTYGKHQSIDGSSFLLFLFFVVFICFPMFISIINGTLRSLRAQMTDEKEIFSFMFDRFQRWIGWKKATAEERDMIMRNEYVDVFELLPRRIDQLFDKINEVNFFIQFRTKKYLFLLVTFVSNGQRGRLDT